jgi:hypothetical protein
MSIEEEEKKTSLPETLKLAEAGSISTMFFTQMIPYNLINDLNVAIDNLHFITTDIEDEDSSKFYCDTSQYLEILTFIYYLLKTRFSDELEPDGEMITYYDGLVESHPQNLVFKRLNLLTHLTHEQLVARHFKKLLTNSKTKDDARHFAHMLED